MTEYIVSCGDVSSGIILNSYDSMTLFDGGIADSTTVYTRGYLYVSSGGTAKGTTVDSRGYLFVSGGGTAKDINAASGAYLTFAVALDTYIAGTSAGSAFEIRDGAVSNYTVYSGGKLDVSSGGAADSTIVKSGGSMRVSSGGTANSTMLNGGFLYVFNSGTVNATEINSGIMNVSSGGRANNITVNIGGELTVFSDGIASGIKENGGYVGEDQDAHLSFVPNSFSGVDLSGYRRDATVHSGTTANNTTICSDASMTVFSGGVANNTELFNYGSMSVSSGGTANSTTIDISTLFIYADGTVNFTTVNRGELYIGSGVTANSTTVNSDGNMIVGSGGIANGITVNSYADLFISSGGTAMNIIENGGYVNVADGTDVSFGSNSFSGLNLGHSSVTVHSGTTANNTNINFSGRLDVFSGGTAKSSTVNSGGNLFISSAGLANILRINSGGTVHVSSGGTANSITVYSSAAIYISSGGTANNISGNGGVMRVSSGGIAQKTIINNNLRTELFGTAFSTTVNPGGYLGVASGGTADGIRVSSGGYLGVASGGTAICIDWTPCVGNVVINEGAYATFISQYSGVYYGSDHQLLSRATAMDSLTISQSGIIHVFSGGVADDIYLYGSMYVNSGGIANNVMVAERGWLYISSGCIASGILANGNLHIASGGTALDVVCPLFGSTVNVEDGAYITYATPHYSGIYYGSNNCLISHTETMGSMTIGSQYEMLVFSGGTTDDILLSCGKLAVSSGGTATDTTVNYLGEFRIFDGGIAENTTVNYYGYLYVLSGGTANNNSLNYTGFMHVSSGGTANFTEVNSGVSMYVSGGGTANGITLNEGGCLYVSSGGTALDIECAPFGGIVSAENGANVTFAPLYGVYYGSGSHQISRSYALDSKTIDSGYKMVILDNGTAENDLVRGGGMLVISDGGRAYYTTVSGSSRNYYNVTNGFVMVSSGGTANHTTVNSIGKLQIFSGGKANNTEINIGGGVEVSSGGTANFNTINNCGCMDIFNGGTANSTTVNSGGSLYVSSGGIANSTMVNDSQGCMRISSGGTANFTMIDNLGSVYIENGGTADGVTIHSSGYLYVSEGGTAANIDWTPCVGKITIENGAQISFASQLSGVYYGSDNQLLSHAQTLTSQTIDSAASICVMSGGIAGAVSGGFLHVYSYYDGIHSSVEGCMYVYSGGIASGGSCAAIVYSGGVASGVSGNAILYSGGVASEFYGTIYVFSGGVANGVSGGATVYSGGTANSITVGSNGLVTLSGGTANDLVTNGGSITIYSGGVANNMAIDGDSLSISGGTANNVFVSRAAMYVGFGGMVSGLEIGGTRESYDYATASMFLAGGTVDNATVNYLGYIRVGYEGTINSVTVNECAGLEVAGIANSVNINSGGSMYVGYGSNYTELMIANDTTVNSGGLLIVKNDGIASNTTVESKGVFKVYGSADNTTVNYLGGLSISSGGTADNTTVKSGGHLDIYSGGVVKNTIVESGGSMRFKDAGISVSDALAIQSGGRLLGYFNYKDISFASGSVLYFDVSDIAPENPDALVDLDGFGELQDALPCAVMIADFQGSGTYKLAKNARGFDQTISIVNSVEDLALISTGQTVEINGNAYTLNLNDGDLTLTVTDLNPQYVYLDFDGESDARYSNPDLNLSLSVSVQVPGFSEAQKQSILSGLSGEYGNSAIFTLERPDVEAYSTLYFGKSDAFADYGDFFAIAETHDDNNQSRDDNAFVLLDTSYSDEQIISVASNMTGRLLGYSGLAYDNTNIRKYAQYKYLLSTEWNQTDPYNKYLPTTDPAERWRFPVGCTNTAAAQLINYWIESGMLDFTLSLDESDVYAVETHDGYLITIDSSDSPINGHLSFGETNRLLENYKLDDEDSIAALSFAAGVLQYANYGQEEGTTTGWHTKLFERAGFKEYSEYDFLKTIDETVATMRYKRTFFDIIQTYIQTNGYVVQELLQGHPVGINIRIPNHALVIDGYDSSTDAFHLNYGWGGDSNGWYTREDLETNVDDIMVGFMPQDVSPNLEIAGLSVDADHVYLNDDITLHFTVSNEGTECSTPTFAYIYSRDELLGWTGFSHVSMGASRDLTCTISASALPVGENTLTVKLYTQKDEDSVSSASLTIQHSDEERPDVPIPKNLTGTAEQVSWDATGAEQYIVEYSMDNFEHVVTVVTAGDAIDIFDLPEGTYQWRVKEADLDEWAVGNEIVAEETGDAPQLVKSDADGNADVFFANAVGTWESGYVAQHVGSIGDWSGTNEYAALYGKNKLADIIEGSTDANILLMTDDENGDTLFVDDIYTASHGDLAEKQSRIAQIDEIWAGAGNDIVDMTSQRFEYIGDGLTIRGGSGNDTIWANKGDNFLFGDAGNDRIVGASGNDVITGGIGNDRLHGGGGEDVFTFCENWGADTVEQLAGGFVTLWFASEQKGVWDDSTLTYTDGENSVKVSGVAAEQITLKFGDDDSDEFATLTGMGAFFDATTERIFEENGKGILASL